jgi:hypothetical protein
VQRLLLTRVMLRADARNNSVAPPEEEDCMSADCAMATKSRVDEEEQRRQTAYFASADEKNEANERLMSKKHGKKMARVRGRTHENARGRRKRAVETSY